MGFFSRLLGRQRDSRRPRISRERMDLLWLSPAQLDIVDATIGTQHEVVIDGENGELKKLRVSRQDLDWARRVDRLAERASDASGRGDYAAAIKHYQNALKQAPGADIYLMSIGACYANMGDHGQALNYLRRAHEISPHNQRISRNLAQLETLMAIRTEGEATGNDTSRRD